MSAMLSVLCRRYPVIDQSSQESLTIVSPTHHRASKRIRIESSPRYSERNGRSVLYTHIHSFSFQFLAENCGLYIVRRFGRN